MAERFDVDGLRKVDMGLFQIANRIATYRAHLDQLSKSTMFFVNACEGCNAERVTMSLDHASDEKLKELIHQCLTHKNTNDSYNDNNRHGGHVDSFDYNFDKDLKETQLPIEYPDDKPDGDD